MERDRAAPTQAHQGARANLGNRASRTDGFNESIERGVRTAALLLLTVVVVVGTCFAPHDFIAIDAVVLGVAGYRRSGAARRGRGAGRRRWPREVVEGGGAKKGGPEREARAKES